MSKEKALSRAEALAMIHLILDQGTVRPTLHCRRDSMPDAHVEMPDVINCLRHGEITREPEWSDEFNNWKYRVEGTALDENELTAITVILEPDFTLLIITVF